VNTTQGGQAAPLRKWSRGDWIGLLALIVAIIALVTPFASHLIRDLQKSQVLITSPTNGVPDKFSSPPAVAGTAAS